MPSADRVAFSQLLIDAPDVTTSENVDECITRSFDAVASGGSVLDFNHFVLALQAVARWRYPQDRSKRSIDVALGWRVMQYSRACLIGVMGCVVPCTCCAVYR